MGEHVVEIGTPDVIVVEELPKLTGKTNKALVNKELLLIAVALVGGDVVAEVDLSLLVGQVGGLALGNLEGHLIIIAVTLGAHPATIEGDAGDEGKGGAASEEALTVNGVDTDGGVARGKGALLTVGLAREPRVEGLGVIGDGVADAKDGVLAQHYELISSNKKVLEKYNVLHYNFLLFEGNGGGMADEQSITNQTTPKRSELQNALG